MVFYFSATGNSKYVAMKIASDTKEELISITDCIRNKKFTFQVGDGERVGFVTPTYFWALPSIVCDFLEQLELHMTNTQHPYLYHVATYGTATGQVSSHVNEFLKKKNLYLNGKFCVQMPDTWTPLFNLTNIDKISKINYAAEKQIAEVSQHICQKNTGNFTRRAVPSAVVNLYYSTYEKQRRTKYFSVEDSCIGCGLCEKSCPIAAIEMQEKKPIWIKEKCTLCLGCLHHCPKFAIQYKNKTKKHGQYVNPYVKL